MRTVRVVVFASLLAPLVWASPAEARLAQAAGLQVALRAHGVNPGPVDGIVGPMTERAIRAFQRRKGLAVDGIVGPRTRAKLGRLGRPLYGRRVMRRGMVGWDVSVLQFRLKRHGAHAGGLDGVFGPRTLASVRRFQQQSRLAVDGIVGPATMRALAGRRAGGGRDPALPSASPAAIRAALDRWAARYGVRGSLVRALAWMESGYQPTVVSGAGAWGVMQVLPATWSFVEVVLLGRPIRRTATGNVRVGVRYLRHLLDLFGGSRRLALGAYHQGAAAVRRHGLYPETRIFVRNVLALERRM